MESASRPDPSQRDQNANAKGLKADLDNLLRNMEKTGKNLENYLSDEQGWSDSEIHEFTSELQRYMKETLPRDVEHGLVDPSTEKGLNEVFEKLLPQARGMQ